MSVSSPETLSAERLLGQLLERHHPRVALACSFQKEEAVLIDMLVRLEPSARVFAIDTGVLFPETYATWREFERRFGVRVERRAALADDGCAWSGGERCCSRAGAKVAALDGALGGLEAWITGLRREQSQTRADAATLEWDTAHGLWKANPLADWTERDVWDYIIERGLPYHPLHDRGYSSIGCAPCTAPGSGREGRWAGSDKTECGLHEPDRAAGTDR